MHQTKYTQGECSRTHTALPWAHISTSRCWAVGKSVWDCHLIIKQSSPTNEPQTGMNSVWPFWWPFTSSCLATGRRSGKCRVNVHKWYTGTSGIKYLCQLRINQIYCILFLIMLNEWFQLFIWNIFKFFAWLRLAFGFFDLRIGGNRKQHNRKYNSPRGQKQIGLTKIDSASVWHVLPLGTLRMLAYRNGLQTMNPNSPLCSELTITRLMHLT